MINARFLLRSSVAALALSAALAQADTAIAPAAAVNTTGAATPSEPVTGWVASAEVSGKRTLAPDTALHESPDSASPVVRRFVSGDGLAVQKVEGAWTQVRLYPGAGVVAVAPAAAPATSLVSAPAVSATPVSVASPPIAVEAPPAVAAQQPPPPAEQETAPASESSAVVAAAAEAERSAPAPAVLPVRVFSGQLVETRGFIFTKPPADYELIDAEGYRIAFVDISKLLRTIDTERLLGRTVQVSGRVQAVRKGRDSLLTAESLLLR